MRIFVTGGTGFVGLRLVTRLTRDGHEVVVLSRGTGAAAALPAAATMVHGDPTVPGPWQETARACDAAINLAGASLSRRWTKRWKKAILRSRVDATRNLVDALIGPASACRAIVSASAIGYYGPRNDEEIDETAPAGEGFLAGVTVAWEAEASRASTAGVRVVLPRFAVVLGEGGGVLERWRPVFKAFLGGRLGSGRQWFSWVHISDLVEAVVVLLDDPGARGPFNVSSPNPVRNRDMAKALGAALHRPALLPVPGFAARIVLGEFAGTILTGQRVVPARLLGRGFAFRHADIREALSGLTG